MPVIDSHHHFWRYNAQDFGWIDDAMRDIRRDFLPVDLEKEIRAAGVDGVVTVQARQSLEETKWLLGMSAQHAFIRGVVGWAPLVDPQAPAILEKLAAEKKLRAVRHVLQREPDERFMLRADFNRGIAALRPLGLAYDILIFERHLPQTIEFVDRHPQQAFVLDHIAKPRIKEGILDPWKKNIRELARRPHVYCKISGLVTEADYTQWTEDQLEPYVCTVFEAFGPKRLMFGSDWPVCLVACGYARWHGLVRKWMEKLSPSEQKRILGETAVEAYRL
ncbi:MAG: amidohydrolase family protein [Gammaproteobacteria bacterium]